MGTTKEQKEQLHRIKAAERRVNNAGLTIATFTIATLIIYNIYSI